MIVESLGWTEFLLPSAGFRPIRLANPTLVAILSHPETLFLEAMSPTSKPDINTFMRNRSRAIAKDGKMADAQKAPEKSSAKKRKTSVPEFVNQVRTETSKVVWPTREETIRTAIFVFIFMVILALFFFGVDSLFNAVVNFLLTLA